MGGAIQLLSDICCCSATVHLLTCFTCCPSKGAKAQGGMHRPPRCLTAFLNYSDFVAGMLCGEPLHLG